MAMFNPPHPGEVLREDILKPLGLSIADTAEQLGVSRKTLSKVLNCRGAITPEMAVRLEKAFKPCAESWLSHQAAYDLWQARKKAESFCVKPIIAPAH
ncbi:MAG: HigA family addiction module antitoxin [Desulfobulbaceae bacterium]|nr:HigA family addiction module antitoxin [Desulfobulbaceae bacterium]HIJ89317.1 HigA family addiction module antidote protein [Deltaproteobacteria bacterium]